MEREKEEWSREQGRERDPLITHVTVKYGAFKLITLSCNFMLVLEADSKEIKGERWEKQSRNQVIIT